MKIGIAVVALSVVLGASAASAQPGWYGYGYGYGYRYGSPYGSGAYYASLPRHRLMSAVREAGLRPVSHPMRTGRHYIVDAVDRHGDLKRVVIDGYYGEVVRVSTVTRPDYPRPYGSRRGTEERARANAPIDLDLPGRPLPRASEQPHGPRPQARIPSEPEVIGPNVPGATDADIDDEEPPMRPRATIQGAREPSEAPGGSIPNAAIPPPPAPLDRNAVKPAPAKPERKTARTNEAAPSATPKNKPRAGAGDSAAVNPAQPPLPRVRPGAQSGEEAVGPPKNKPVGAARTASPRVILPGGPTPKADAAAPAPASPSLDGENPPATSLPSPTPAPAAPLPPMQSLD